MNASQQVNDVINNICNKLGYAASELTPEMARYMSIRTGTFAGVGFLILIVAALLWMATVKTYRKSYDEDDCIEPGVGAVFTTALGGGLAIGYTIRFIGWIVAPKAMMVQWVLENIGGSV